MAWRLTASVLAPGAIITAVLLAPAGPTAFVSPTLLLAYCAAGVAVAGALATNYFATQCAKREYGWCPPGRFWWGVLWRTALTLAALLAAGWLLALALPLRGPLLWAAMGLAAGTVCLGTVLALGRFTLSVIHRRARAALKDWDDPQDAAVPRAAVPPAPPARVPATPPAKPPRPAVVPSGPGPAPAPQAAPGPRGPAAASPPRGPARATSTPPRPAGAPPAKPIPMREGTFDARFWQNVVGGWELEIAYLVEKGNGGAAERRVLYRTDRRPRPFGAPYGGFYSRAAAEEFARSHIAQRLASLNLDEVVRRAPRYRIPGGLPATLNPAGSAEVQDLSLGGACAEHERPLAPGQDVLLSLQLPAGSFGSPARVVWSAPARPAPPGGDGGQRFRSGVQFVAPAPLDLGTLRAYLATA